MSDARDLALAVLPHFAVNVLARRVRPYGYYARAIGRDPAKESPVIGPAMHAIGGVCVFAGVPVAPLYFVERADLGWRAVFESDIIESKYVLPHYDNLYVSAREHNYTRDEFERVERGLRKIVPRDWSPHRIWYSAIFRKLEGSEQTYFERALARYDTIIEKAREARRAQLARQSGVDNRK